MTKKTTPEYGDVSSLLPLALEAVDAIKQVEGVRSQFPHSADRGKWPASKTPERVMQFVSLIEQPVSQLRVYCAVCGHFWPTVKSGLIKACLELHANMPVPKAIDWKRHPSGFEALWTDAESVVRASDALGHAVKTWIPRYDERIVVWHFDHTTVGLGTGRDTPGRSEFHTLLEREWNLAGLPSGSDAKHSGPESGTSIGQPPPNPYEVQTEPESTTDGESAPSECDEQQADGGTEATINDCASVVHVPTEDDSLPAKVRKTAPSRDKARAAYDWALSEIPGAADMTIAELYDAIEHHPSDAYKALPPTAESFARYLRDTGLNIYNKAEKGRRTVRKADEI